MNNTVHNFYTKIAITKTSLFVEETFYLSEKRTEKTQKGNTFARPQAIFSVPFTLCVRNFGKQAKQELIGA
jgi:hypothetical protein